MVDLKQKIAVLGLGYIGLPLTAALANAGYEVIAVDISNEKIEGLKKGIVYLYEPGLRETLANEKGKIEFTTDDGQKHKLAFNADNGIPTVQFDDNAPETLLNAQGRNGSFFYDPEKGLWYAENGHLLPLLEAFRDGIATRVGPDNTVNSTASG